MEKVTREYVESLPLKEANMGGVRKSVRYDEKAGKVYGLDDRGRWNGTVRDVPAAHKPSDTAASHAAQKTTATTSPQTVPPQPSETAAAQTAAPKTSPVDFPPPLSAVEEPVEPKMKELDSDPKPVQKPLVNPQGPVESAPIAPGDIFFDDTIVPNIPDDPGEPRKKSSVLTKVIYSLLAILLVGFLIMMFIGGKMASQENNSTVGLESTNPSDLHNSTEPSASTVTAPTTETTAPVETEPETMVEVLTSVNAMIPGQIITEETFEVTEVTENDYRALSASVGLYTSNELGEIVGLVAVKYIPAGKYVSYNDVGRSYASVNPWIGEDKGYYHISLPVTPTPENLTFFNWANTVNLTISVQTKQTNDNTSDDAEKGDEEKKTPAGMEHESSVLEAMVVDTYRLSNVRITDLSNSAGESLYSRYYAIADIPSAFQREYLYSTYQDVTTLYMDIPAFIVIRVSKAQYELLSELPKESMTVEIKDPLFVSGSALQNETYTKIRDAESVIAETWITVEGENNAEGNQ